MSKPSKKSKLYCYVDETGQDTEGRLFFVVVVIVADEREALRQTLAEIEERTGKHSKKWSRSTPRQREAYIQQILRHAAATGISFYYSVYPETRAYVDLTILSVAKAINTHTADSYTATILVDGLERTEQHRFARGLRNLRISTRKVRGVNDQSDAFIRLADALAGFVRDGHEGDKHMKPHYDEALRSNTIREV